MANRRPNRIKPNLGWVRRSDNVDLNLADCLNHHGDAFNSINYLHDKVHRAVSFRTSYLWNTLADDANGDLLLRVASIPVHFEFLTVVGGDCLAYLYEDVTVTDPGTPVTVRNQVRFSGLWPSDGASGSEGNTATVFVGPTFSGGDDLTNGGRFIQGGSGPQSGGGSGGSRQEDVLKLNTDYVIRHTNISGQPKIVEVRLYWYEHFLGLDPYNYLGE